MRPKSKLEIIWSENSKMWEARNPGSETIVFKAATFQDVSRMIRDTTLEPDPESRRFPEQ